MQPWMSEDEIDLIERELTRCALGIGREPQMLEWGAGGSTHRFSPFCRRYVSIEHDDDWAEKANGLPKVLLNLVPQNSARPMETRDAYCPGYRAAFRNYIEFPRTLGLKFDAVLIDGRARLFCAIEALNHMTPEAVMFIHDYHRRPRYHLIEQWCEKVGEVTEGQTLVVLRRRA